MQVRVVGENGQPLAYTTVELLRGDSALLKVAVTDSSGGVRFDHNRETHLVKISRSGYRGQVHKVETPSVPLLVTLLPLSGALQGVTVTTRKPFLEMQPGRTVVNLENNISSVGTSVLETLEKLPGVTVDKEGGIRLKGRAGVTVMIDGKPTYLSGADLNNLLNGMSASSLAQIELMDQPPAQYDAAGNAGIINLRTKKIRTAGWNGTLTTAYAQGQYPKANNSLLLNYRNGRWNLFLNYSNNISRNFWEVTALRTYLAPDEKTVLSYLDQPSYTDIRTRLHNLRTGIDYSFNAKTSLGLTLTGTDLLKENTADNTASWLNARGATDSLINTVTSTTTDFHNLGGTLSFHHALSATRELSADIDMLNYGITTRQAFQNQTVFPLNDSELTRGRIPTSIGILSAKADYSSQEKGWKWDAGVKASRIQTDNEADYQYLDTTWKPDYGKTNHFIYTENIQAAYWSAQAAWQKWSFQGGLRFERTVYEANQLGNALVKGSSLSRSYNSLFPSLFVSYALDSSNSFTFSAGRRIDRPGFQKLNPFVLIINKYTWQAGNPYFLPQYTWSAEVAHSYKGWLTNSLGYSITTDYFSQIFPVDSNGIVIYTEGNLGQLQVLSWTSSVQLAPRPWWNLVFQGTLYHRIMEGTIGRRYDVSVTQFNLNLNNQLRFKKGWGAELSGFYTSTGRNDIQEIVDPAGQLTVGLSKTVLKNQGTLKLAVRDIFYTQWMKGFTYFTQATESFKLIRDSRVVTLSFSYRFGKTFKANKRSSGSAGEEIQRVGTGS